MPTKKSVKSNTPKTEIIEKETPAFPTGKYYYANGKRKTSVAKVRLYKGAGVISINGKSLNEFCTVKSLMGLIKSPLKLTATDKKFDIIAIASGGGLQSQASAVRHGIAKALVISDPLNRPVLKKAGMLTRDPRVKERKKYGLKRARRAPQFSKR